MFHGELHFTTLQFCINFFFKWKILCLNDAKRNFGFDGLQRYEDVEAGDVPGNMQIFTVLA